MTTSFRAIVPSEFSMARRAPHTPHQRVTRPACRARRRVPRFSPSRSTCSRSRRSCSMSSRSGRCRLWVPRLVPMPLLRITATTSQPSWGPQALGPALPARPATVSPFPASTSSAPTSRATGIGTMQRSRWAAGQRARACSRPKSLRRSTMVRRVSLTSPIPA